MNHPCQSQTTPQRSGSRERPLARAWLLLVLLGLLALPATARAEGPLSGGTRVYLEEEPVGPFSITSFAAPNPPTTKDNLWVTVKVREGAKAVQDARVWVTVVPEGATGEPQRMEAQHELAAQAIDYTAFLPVPTAGSYRVEIEVEHPQGSGRTSYPVAVSEPLTRYIFLVVGIPFALLAIWLVRTLEKRLPERSPSGGGLEEGHPSSEALRE